MNFYVGFANGPWFYFANILFGVLIGYLLHWLLEYLFWRNAQPKKPTPVQATQNIPSKPAIQAVTAHNVTKYDPNKAGYPQHLSDVKGIGTIFEDRLYKAGVGTYWQLSEIKKEALLKALKLEDEDLVKINYNEIVADAKRLARETKSVGRLWNSEMPDNFEPLKGIGYVYEKKLYEAGIYTYGLLANSSKEELAKAIGDVNVANPPNFNQWIADARKIAQK
jgi:predicted flap endonuclease-1-like 5' DNA nuclease